VSPDARWIVSGSKDRGVQFWDPNSGHQQFMLQGHKNSGELIVGEYSTSLHEKYSYIKFCHIVISVALSPNGNKYFATGSGDLRARVWRYAEIEPQYPP
jgi:general transcriptional corepressor TUP1